MKNITLLFLITFLFSCQEKKQEETDNSTDFPAIEKRSTLRTKVKIGMEDQTDLTIVSQTKDRILDRFKDLGLEVTVENWIEEQGFIFSTKVDSTDQEEISKFRSAFRSTDFGMYHSYRVDDREIGEMIESIPKLPSFSINKNLFQSEIIGACSDINERENIKNTLDKIFQKNESLKLMWGKYPVGNDSSSYPLYMIKGLQPSVTSKYVKKSEAQMGNLGRPEIYIEMTEEGREAWYRMTKKASDNGARCIAIVINEEVYSVPRVANGPMARGRSSIVGEFNLMEATSLANSLKFGALLYPATIYEEKIID